MEKHRLSTTISQKHWELLKKHSCRFETQQKALEHAMEMMENGNGKSLTPEEKLWIHYGCEMRSICGVTREMLRTFLNSSDIESVFQATRKMMIYFIEDHYQKPLRKCSLKEILDGLVFNGRVVNWFESVNYEDKEMYYCLRFVHSFSLNSSRLNNGWIEELFNEYGKKTESYISEHSIFVKVYKN